MTAVKTCVASRVRPVHISRVEFDPAACRLIAAAAMTGGLDIGYRGGPGLVLVVHPRASAGTVLHVRGAQAALSVDSLATPYAIAAVLLALGDATGVRPRCRFPWPRHHRLTVMFGLTGQAAQVRDVLRRSEPDPRRRPVIQSAD